MLPQPLSLDAPQCPAAEERLSPTPAFEPDPLANEIRGLAPRQAIEVCVRRLGPSVGRMCMALLASRPEAEEAAQEVFLQASLGLEQFRGEGTVRSWIFKIARRTCARRLEMRTRRRGLLTLVQGSEHAPMRPDEAAEARDSGQAVRTALEELRPSQREVLVLRYEAGLSFHEIALSCGIDEATARKRASRALQRLRELLPLEELR
jgi:RNA polymerase sigma-70 factor, ECF subfamily